MPNKEVLRVGELAKEYLEIKNINKDLGDLGFINFVFQNCYLRNANTEEYFLSLFNKTEMDYSRYIYFYINYLISEKKYKEAKEITVTRYFEEIVKE